MSGKLRGSNGDRPGVRPLPVPRATIWRLTAGVLAVYVATLLLAILVR